VEGDSGEGDNGPSGAPETAGRATAEPIEDEDGLKPLPERLITELTAYRTLALWDALAGDPDTALLTVLHVLCLKTFYRYAVDTCLEIDVKSTTLGTQAPGLGDTAAARAIETRHQHWANQLPHDPEGLWDALVGFDADSRMALFAHCVESSVQK
jgi:ParB family chromosome partitioning protein